MGPASAWYRSSPGKMRRVKTEHDPTKRGLALTEEAALCQYEAWKAPPGARAVSAFHAGPPQWQMGQSRARRADLVLVLPPADGEDGPVVLKVVNYHGFWHTQAWMGLGLADDVPGAGLRGPERRGPMVRREGHSAHFEWCRLYAEDAARAEERGMERPLGCQYNGDTADLDLFNAGYAEAMSAVSPSKFKMTYESLSRCQLYCGNGPRENPREALRAAAAAGDESVVLPPTELAGIPLYADQVSSKKMLRSLLEAGPGLSGLVTLSGGVQGERRSTSSRLMAFLPQRFKPEPEELGEGALRLSRAAAASTGETPEQYLRRFCDERSELTLCAYSFRKPTTMSLELLRYLVRYKGLKNFKIVHAALYACKPYCGEDLVKDLLEARHRAKAAGNDLLSAVIKLLNNSLYGYSMVKSYDFTKVDVVGEKQLATKAHRDSVATLVAVVGPEPGKRKRGPRLFFLAEKGYEGRSRSLTQIGASVLSQSKVNFFRALCKFLDCFPIDSVELLYQVR